MQQPQMFCKFQKKCTNPSCTRIHVLDNGLISNIPAPLQIPQLPVFPISPVIKAPRNRNRKGKKPKLLDIPEIPDIPAPKASKGYIKGLKNEIDNLKATQNELIELLKANNIEIPKHIV